MHYDLAYPSFADQWVGPTNTEWNNNPFHLPYFGP